MLYPCEPETAFQEIFKRPEVGEVTVKPVGPARPADGAYEVEL